MNYTPLYVESDHFYSVGVDEETGEYLIEVWLALYSIYFRLLPDEVETFKRDPHALRELSYELAADKGDAQFKDRLVLNDEPQG